MTTTTRALAIVDDLDQVDLTDPRTFAEYDIYDMWRKIRSQRPVYWHPDPGPCGGFWVVSGYHDNVRVYRDNENFGSERGTILTSLLRGSDSGGGKMISATDGRRHRDIRAALYKSLTPRYLDRIMAGIRQRTRELVLGMIGRDEFDFARDVAQKIPIGTICQMMGVPVEDWPMLGGWSQSVLSSDRPDADESEMMMARYDTLNYFAKLLRYRRANPGDDLVSVLANAVVEGQPLSDEDIMSNCYSLLLGGEESSRVSSIGAVLAFTEYPDQWRALKRGEVAVVSAVDEILRWTTPSMHFGRVANRDVTVGGHLIRAGEVVTLWSTSANRDPAAFTDPETFDLGRAPNRHLSFGHGQHHCIGAQLGRAQLGIMLETLRAEVNRITLRGEPQLIYSNFLRGHSSLPVAFHR